jgi:hypothetical protein
MANEEGRAHGYKRRFPSLCTLSAASGPLGGVGVRPLERGTRKGDSPVPHQLEHAAQLFRSLAQSRVLWDESVKRKVHFFQS